MEGEIKQEIETMTKKEAAIIALGLRNTLYQLTLIGIIGLLLTGGASFLHKQGGLFMAILFMSFFVWQYKKNDTEIKYLKTKYGL